MDSNMSMSESWMARASSCILSEDLLIQILVYLPVRSLLRFKSVSKSWLALIENSDFIHLHLTTTLPPNNSSQFATLIFQALTIPYGINIFMLSGDVNNVTFVDLSMPTLLAFDDDDDDDLGLLLGTCNGIVCFHHEMNNIVTLWNPATKQFRLVPKSLTDAAAVFSNNKNYYNDFVAFGFDVKTKEYKVVRVGAYIQEPWKDVNNYYKVVRVQVYSLRTDSWRFIEDITSLPASPYEQTFMSHGMYLNGSYFVLGLKHFNDEEEDVLDRKVILSFDFTQETFSTMQLPNQAANLLTLICLDGKIALMDLADKYDSQINTYNIWVLNEIGVKESWTKLYSIGPVYRGLDAARGICRILKNGEFAILSLGFSYGCKLLQLFNIVTKEVKDLQTDYGEVIRADVYKESLVPISRNGTSADDRVIGGAL